MCSSVSTPTQAPPAAISTDADPSVIAARDAERKRIAMAGGRQSTILTMSRNPGMLAPTSTQPKTVLGA